PLATRVSRLFALRSSPSARLPLRCPLSPENPQREPRPESRSREPTRAIPAPVSRPWTLDSRLSEDSMAATREGLMGKIVAHCNPRGFVFQSSEIYGGLNGFWDYGPLGVELKRNVRNTWWEDMVSRHDSLDAPAGAPQTFQMVGIESSIIMHPQVW